MNKTLCALALATGALVAVGCSKPPTDAVDAAKAALDAARASEAAEYAAESLAAADSAASALDAELQTQSEGFALTRSYTKAAELASTAKAAADKAEADAKAGKEAAKAQATMLIEGVRTSTDAVKQMLATAPRGKGTKADLEAMSSDVAAVETGLPELDAALAAGRYKEAQARAEAAQQTLDRIKADIEAAIAARGGR